MTDILISGGWLGKDIEEQAKQQIQSELVPFKLVARDSKSHVPICQLMQRVNRGKNLFPPQQQTGDCCSFGAKNVLEYLQAALICIHSQPITLKRVYAPFIYGMSRCAPDCGNGTMGRSAGSTGAWTAMACKKYGVLFCDDPDVPAYSGAIADRWGYRGVPEQFVREASDNLVRGIANLQTVEQLRSALLNYNPVTIASTWGFRVTEYKGYKVYSPSGSWAHQMCFLDWMDEPFPAAYRLNSWGDCTGPSLHGEPLGGAWVRAQDIERELASGDCELYAYSAFDGFNSVGDFSLI
jgi:hypothetical protein